MGIFHQLCTAISFGVLIGFFAGAIKSAKSPSYTSEQVAQVQQFLKKLTAVLKYVTMLSLTLGLLWCFYYLVLGIYDTGQAEYATNMAQLIVSFLTVISIIFAFFEFLSHKGKG